MKVPPRKWLPKPGVTGSNPVGRAIPEKATSKVAFFGVACLSADENFPGSSRARPRRARQQCLAKALTRRVTALRRGILPGAAIKLSVQTVLAGEEARLL